MRSDQRRTTDAVEIFHRRYIGEDPRRKGALEQARVNAEVARTIYELRTEARLTQGQLADLVGTTQSVISRLEDEDYEGHSLTMLNRIAAVLDRKMTILLTGGRAETHIRRTGRRSVQEVVARPDGTWATVRPGAKRASSVYKTQRQAVTAAVRQAKVAAPSQVIIHASDGSVQEERTYLRSAESPARGAA